MSLLMVFPARSATITAEKGENTFLFNQNSAMTLTVSTASSSSESGTGASVFAFTSSRYTAGGLYCGYHGGWASNMGIPIYTINGRTGIKIAEGIALIPANGQFSGQMSVAGKLYSGSATTNPSGNLQLSNAYYGAKDWCVQAVPQPTSPTSGVRNAGTHAGNFSLSWYVYVAPSVAVGTTATIPTFYVSRSIAGSVWGYASSILSNASGNVIKVTSTKCTVSTPSQIRFNNVDAGSTSGVISSDGGLDLSCNGESPTVDVSYTAQAISATRTQTQLIMRNSQNQPQGTIRGFIGTNANSEAGCYDTATSLLFGAAPKSLLTRVANNATYNIPLKWVLCPDSSAVPGQGTASANLDIIWQ